MGSKGTSKSRPCDQFLSYYYDTETGFYYLQSRYYDPTVGRFLNADHPELIGANGGIQGNNLFAYCNNNPITYTDETGNSILPYLRRGLKTLSKWAEMIENHRWNAIHIAVQLAILEDAYSSGCIGVAMEYPVGLGRADIIDVLTGEVWEIKPNSQTSGVAAARKSLLKYYPAIYSGRFRTHQTSLGEAGRFSGTLSNHAIDGFANTYDIYYWTPEAGVILYDFCVHNKKTQYSRNPNPEASGSWRLDLAIGVATGIAVGFGASFGGGGMVWDEPKRVLYVY